MLRKTCGFTFALLFLFGLYGGLYARTISFGGYSPAVNSTVLYNWSVKSTTGTGTAGPGPNRFSGNVNKVWADSTGLHMTISTTAGSDTTWYCTEIFLPSSLGYGTYFMHTHGRFDNIDRNMVAGFFTYASDTQELDIEFARWGSSNPNYPPCGFSVQAPSPPGSFNNTYAMTQSSTNQDLTLILTWAYHTAIMSVYYGYQTWGNLSAANLVATHTYTNIYVPVPGPERWRVNFWLMSGLAPVNNTPAEFVITDFAFLPPGTPVPVELSDFSASNSDSPMEIKENTDTFREDKL